MSARWRMLPAHLRPMRWIFSWRPLTRISTISSGFCRGLVRCERHRAGAEVRIGCRGYIALRLVSAALDQVPHVGRFGSLMEIEGLALDLAVGHGESMMASQVLDPVGAVIALDPDLRVGHVLH